MSDAAEWAHMVRARLENSGARLQPRMTAAQVEEFEQKFGIRLPGDFADFLRIVANGSSGPPDYGLVALGDTPKDLVVSSGFVLARARQAFPLTSARFWSARSDDDSTTWFRKDFAGALVLGTDGCGLYYVLVLNGSWAGTIWVYCDVGVLPLEPRTTFRDWIDAWLDGT